MMSLLFELNDQHQLEAPIINIIQSAVVVDFVPKT